MSDTETMLVKPLIIGQHAVITPHTCSLQHVQVSYLSPNVYNFNAWVKCSMGEERQCTTGYAGRCLAWQEVQSTRKGQPSPSAAFQFVNTPETSYLSVSYLPQTPYITNSNFNSTLHNSTEVNFLQPLQHVLCNVL